MVLSGSEPKEEAIALCMSTLGAIAPVVAATNSEKARRENGAKKRAVGGRKALNSRAVRRQQAGLRQATHRWLPRNWLCPLRRLERRLERRPVEGGGGKPNHSCIAA